ncbi:hypothetical protein [Barrientosiimonas endolithica]|uniref:DUF4352 domain-containing protein n=1 Tax=Barrientosiimonas endolithica TaxID=1535208 RepID=A0ABM8H9G9_9MICO|nr:hypothetical protein [Barrientosiimonas endolithica]BDZ57572.1 hypothetical protein GCM10025872_12290 [Barrientosiimonas endolithica]
MNKSRRASFLVAPAVLAAMTLSACQDEAPTAAPPTAASQPPSPSQTQGPAPTSQAPAPAPSSQAPAPAPSSTAAPAPAPSSGGAGQCDSSSSYTLERGSVQPKPVGTAQRAKTDKGGEVEVTIGKPTVDSSSGDSYFPGDGMQTVIYPVTVKAVSDSYVSTPLSIGLVDSSDEPCSADFGIVVPRGQRLPIEILQQGDTASGKAAFAVPAGADLSKIYVLFADDYSGGDAQLAWNGN